MALQVRTSRTLPVKTGNEDAAILETPAFHVIPQADRTSQLRQTGLDDRSARPAWTETPDEPHDLPCPATAMCLFADLLTRLPYGVAVVDHRGLVRFASERLEKLLGDGLTVCGGRLSTATPQAQKSLQSLLDSALKPSGSPARNALRLERPSGRRPLFITVTPFRTPEFVRSVDNGLPRCDALVVVVDLESEDRGLVEERLRSLGLTAAQARLAARLGPNRSLAEVAETLGIAENTARTHLKQIFQKLAVRKQTELVDIVSRLGSVLTG